MNFKFERDVFLKALQKPQFNIVYDDDLKTLKGMKIAIDATLLLAKAGGEANPQKFLQEGGAALDVQLQNKLVEIIEKLRLHYSIELLVVIDGLMPRFVSDKQPNILEKSKAVWQELRQVKSGSSTNERLFGTILETYGPRCFLSEIMNACLSTNTNFFIAPYSASPQLVHFFIESMVNAVMGSLQCLLFELPEGEDCSELPQVIVDFDLAEGSFSFVDSKELLEKVSSRQAKSKEELSELMIFFGGIYNIKFGNVDSTAEQECAELISIIEEFQKDGAQVVHHLSSPMHMADFALSKLIFQMSPILNNECKLESLNKSSYEGSMIGELMGLCFNNEIYFQMCKGMIHPDILEMLSNQNILSSAIIAPSMYIKQIWEDDDYKFYFEQVLANLHDQHSNMDNLAPKLREFYSQNGIRYQRLASSSQSELSIKNWGLEEPQIREEMARQGMSSSKNSDGDHSPAATLLFAMKWFNSDLTNKGKTSDLVKGLIDNDQTGVKKVETENELMSLCYLSYLETNNYLKSNQKYLFGELVRSTSKTIYQEQVFLFLEMLKVFFPGGDSLVAPNALAEFEGLTLLGTEQPVVGPNDSSIRLLSRIFSMISFEDAGISLSRKQLAKVQNISKIDFDIAQFCSLVERFKFTWRTSFQVILFRTFMQGRSSVENCQKIIRKLSFRKQESCGLVGLLLKSILTRKNLQGPGGLMAEFGFLTDRDLVKVMEFGAELWIILKKMHQTACNRTQNSEGDPVQQNKGDANNAMRQQFDRAHAFFLQKMQEHNAANNSMFSGVVSILTSSDSSSSHASKKKDKKLNLKSTESAQDGLSSQ